MKPLDSEEFAPYRIATEYAKEQIGKYYDRNNAVMQIPCGVFMLRVIASIGDGWDHVSVSLASRTPTWAELEFVRKMLFKPHEIVVQFHVPSDKHINIHPNCLHLWREHGQKVRLPPSYLV